ncbi:hypothetical protein [Weissella viridescens]|uniref:hypothetical protein n=1 Tax=Weissella viridescens TaxID=1629 RepID=UPI0022E10EC5|nr:hypothetical protein [Weissella viridescens]
MAKIRQYLKENAYSLVAIFTETFVFGMYFDEWVKASLGLKVCMIMIWAIYIYLGTYTDVLIATVKSQNKHILWQAEKIEALKKEQRHD